MTLEHCWSQFLKAEAYLEQGYPSSAEPLLTEVAAELPHQIQRSLDAQMLKPCQFMCLVDGYRQACVQLSEVLNRQDEAERAFTLLNEAYGYMQWLSQSQTPLIKATAGELHKYIGDLYRHLEAFCSAQCNTLWAAQFDHIKKAHQYFYQ